MYPKASETVIAEGHLFSKLPFDADGRAQRVQSVTGPCKAGKDYLTSMISSWEFEQLRLEGTKRSYYGVISVPFCYGSFRKC